MIRRLYLKFQLWRRGYCPRHLQEKRRISSFSYHWYCPECDAEKAAKRALGYSEDKAKVERWLKELRCSGE